VRLIKGMLVICLLIFIGEAWGQDCSVSAITVNFGDYFSFNPSSVDANGDITIVCSSGISYIIKLGPGVHSGNSFSSRKMLVIGGGSTLNYNLYRDSARTEVWGDGTSSTYTQSGSGTGGENHFIVYGRIPEGQNVSVGSYSDSLAVTIEW